MTTLDFDNIIKEKKTKEHFQQVVDNYGEVFVENSFSKLLGEIMKEKKFTKNKLVQKSHINRVYCYEIISGKKNPSRDNVIKLCISMLLNINQSNLLLRCAGYAPLYSKDKRDCCFIFGLNNECSFLAVNEMLYDMKLKLLD